MDIYQAKRHVKEIRVNNMNRERIPEWTRTPIPLYRKNSGSTMAEVLVGFAFLMILMVAFVHILQVSSDFLMEASDEVSLQGELQEELYKKTPDVTVVDVQTWPDVALTFVEVEDADGGVADADGVRLTLERGYLRGTTHRELGKTVYQVLYMEETGTKEPE
jgi:hypothetical protein